MFTSPSCYKPLIAGLIFAIVLGCQTAPPQKSSPGNLPGQIPPSREPRVTATTYLAHGHLLERQGQFERAIVQYQKALRMQPDFVTARNRLGITYNKLGRHAEASAQFRQALCDRPGTAFLYNNLGFSLYLEGEYEEAEAALTEALRLKEQYARAHMNYALVLAKLKQFETAWVELTKACELPDACYNMGILLTEAERYADAARYLEQALQLRPGYEAARAQLHEVGRLAAEWEAYQAAHALAAELKNEQKPEEPAPAEEQPVEQNAPTAPALAQNNVEEEPAEAPEAETIEEEEPVMANAHPVPIEPAPTETPPPTETVAAAPAETMVTEPTDTKPQETTVTQPEQPVVEEGPAKETVAVAPPTADESAPESSDTDSWATPVEAEEPESGWDWLSVWDNWEWLSENTSMPQAQAAPTTAEEEPCDESNPEFIRILWQRDEERLVQLTENDDWSWLLSLANDAPWPPAVDQPNQPPAIAEDWKPDTPSEPPSWDWDDQQEAGIDARLLAAMIEETVRAWNQGYGDEFDQLWCRLGYYIFPESAPEEPENFNAQWLVDQSDLEKARETGLAK